MKIAVFNGSPRKANTAAMVQAFCEGAQAAGHEVETYHVGKMKIEGCHGCEYCHTKGNGQCVQKDDMENIYQKLPEAEMLVIASPIYYHNMSGQLKCTIDRFYAAAFPDKPPKLKKVAMFLSSEKPDMYDGAVFSYQGDFLDYLQLEGMGVFTVNGYDPDVLEKKREELRGFGASL